MELNIGNNLTSLLERLAHTIGVTAEQVFPWYVQQVYLEGVTTLIILGFLILGISIGLIYTWPRAKFTEDDFNRYSALAIVFSILCAPLTFWGVICEGGTTAIRKIMNPQYYAMERIVKHVNGIGVRR